MAGLTVNLIIYSIDGRMFEFELVTANEINLGLIEWDDLCYLIVSSEKPINENIDSSIDVILQIKIWKWKAWWFNPLNVTGTRMWNCTGIFSYRCLWKSKYTKHVVGNKCSLIGSYKISRGGNLVGSIYNILYLWQNFWICTSHCIWNQNWDNWKDWYGLFNWFLWNI